MKRFFCTICGKVKRVRSIPSNTRNPQHTNVMQRMGECDRHSAQFTPMNRVQADARITKKRVS